MDPSPPTLANSPLPFLHLMQGLKHLPRTGWLRTVSHPESVASHSFRLALLGSLAPSNLDRAQYKKNEKEARAFQYLTDLLKPYQPQLATDILNAWKDYEYGRTPEGRWMKEMDKFECLVQAHEYEQRTLGEKDLEEFQGLKAKVSSPTGLEWVRILDAERLAHRFMRQRNLSLIIMTGNPTLVDSVRLCKELGLQLLSVEKILRKASEDSGFPHAEFVRTGLNRLEEIPADLIISQLEPYLKTTPQDSWTVIQGLPWIHVVEFARQVQKPQCVLHLGDAVSTSGDRSQWTTDCIHQTICGASAQENFEVVKETIQKLQQGKA